MLLWIIIIGVLLILALVFLAIALRFFRDANACSNNFSPWCYKDWKCTNYPPTDPRYKIAEYTAQQIKNCTGIDEKYGTPVSTCTVPGWDFNKV